MNHLGPNPAVAVAVATATVAVVKAGVLAGTVSLTAKVAKFTVDMLSKTYSMSNKLNNIDDRLKMLRMRYDLINTRNSEMKKSQENIERELEAINDGIKEKKATLKDSGHNSKFYRGELRKEINALIREKRKWKNFQSEYIEIRQQNADTRRRLELEYNGLNNEKGEAICGVLGPVCSVLGLNK